MFFFGFALPCCFFFYLSWERDKCPGVLLNYELTNACGKRKHFSLHPPCSHASIRNTFEGAVLLIRSSMTFRYIRSEQEWTMCLKLVVLVMRCMYNIHFATHHCYFTYIIWDNERSRNRYKKEPVNATIEKYQITIYTIRTMRTMFIIREEIFRLSVDIQLSDSLQFMRCAVTRIRRYEEGWMKENSALYHSHKQPASHQSIYSPTHKYDNRSMDSEHVHMICIIYN